MLFCREDITNRTIFYYDTVLLLSYLSSHQDINSVEENTVHASSKIFLISQKNFIEIAHTSDKDPEVNIQLVETTGKVDSEKQKSLRLPNKINTSQSNKYYCEEIILLMRNNILSSVPFCTYDFIVIDQLTQSKSKA